MSTYQSTVTPAERIEAQRYAYQRALLRDKWSRKTESLFLMTPIEMENLFAELAELRERVAKLPPMTKD